MLETASIFGWVAWIYLLVLCAAGCWRGRRRLQALHDPVSALLASLAATIPEDAAAAIPELVLPEVAVSAAAPAAFGLADVAGIGAGLAGAAGVGADIAGGIGGGAAASTTSAAPSLPSATTGEDQVIPAPGQTPLPSLMPADFNATTGLPSLNLPGMGAPATTGDVVLPSTPVTPTPTLAQGGAISPIGPGPSAAPPELSVGADLSNPADTTIGTSTSGGVPSAGPTGTATTGPGASDTLSGPVGGGGAPDVSTAPTGTATTGSGAAAGGTATPADPTDLGGGNFGGGGPTTGSNGLLAKAGLGGVSSFLKDNKDLLSLGGLLGPLFSMFTQPNFSALTDAALAANNNASGVATANQTAVSGTELPLASSEAGTALSLQNAESTGVLPPGVTTAIDQALRTSQAGIRSSYANLGLSGSTSEAEDISGANATIQGQVPAILASLVNQGISLGQTSATNANSATSATSPVVSAAGNQATTDLNVAEFELLQDQEMQQALSNLAKALGTAAAA